MALKGADRARSFSSLGRKNTATKEEERKRESKKVIDSGMIALSKAVRYCSEKLSIIFSDIYSWSGY
jgi:hypothetical protein